MTTPLEYLSNGQWVQAVLTLYTSLMGTWFYTLIIFTIMVMIYLKSENLPLTAISTIIMISFFKYAGIYPAGIANIVMLVVVFGITFAILSLTKRSTY